MYVLVWRPKLVNIWLFLGWTRQFHMVAYTKGSNLRVNHDI